MIGLDSGEQEDRITIERETTTTDEYGGEVPTWSPLCRPWAKVTYGRGDERRQAAQESASLVATFRVRASANTRAAEPAGHRIVFDGANWDISSNVAFGRTGRDITAIRKA